MDFETVFHTHSGYPLMGLVLAEKATYYAHATDIYDGMILYALTPISYDEAELLMRNALQLRELVERATHTVEFNTSTGSFIKSEITEKTRLNLPKTGTFLY